MARHADPSTRTEPADRRAQRAWAYKLIDEMLWFFWTAHAVVASKIRRDAIKTGTRRDHPGARGRGPHRRRRACDTPHLNIAVLVTNREHRQLGKRTWDSDWRKRNWRTLHSWHAGATMMTCMTASWPADLGPAALPDSTAAWQPRSSATASAERVSHAWREMNRWLRAGVITATSPLRRTVSTRLRARKFAPALGQSQTRLNRHKWRRGENHRRARPAGPEVRAREKVSVSNGAMHGSPRIF